MTRGCFWPVYWNKGVSNSTRGCSNIQVQNNPVLNFVWLLFEFHQFDISLSFWCHFIILISFYHLEVIPSFWCYSIILISFHHPEAIPSFWFNLSFWSHSIERQRDQVIAYSISLDFQIRLINCDISHSVLIRHFFVVLEWQND